MSVYTKTGDNGETSIIGGGRLLKCDTQIEACGAIDELSSFIGLVISKIKEEDTKIQLTLIQKDLFLIMAVLAGKKKSIVDLEKKIKGFEKTIDEIEKKIKKINCFVVPQGDEISCWFHVLRTICRKAERRTIKFLFKNNEMKKFKSVVKYLNRLSDLLFIFARFYNKKEFYI